MRPLRRPTMKGATARIVLAVPVRLMSIWSRQSASSISIRGLKAWMPATAASTSIRPNAVLTASACTCNAA